LFISVLQGFEGAGPAETSTELYQNTWFIPYENKEIVTVIVVALDRP